MKRLLLYMTSIAVLFWGAVLVPMPLIEFSPGSASSIPPLVQIEETPTTEIDGDLRLLTIRVAQPTVLETVRAWFSPTRDLVRRDSVVPSDQSQQEYFEAQRLQFNRSFDTAVAVGLQAAGESIEVRTAPLVVRVLEEGPSDGVLREGDVVLAFQGESIASSEDLVAAARDTEAGDVVSLTVERGDEELDVEVEVGQAAGMERPGLGVLIETIANDIVLPYPVDLNETSIGGPSAGLMIALTVYDLVSEENLAAGRDIAGTGTIDGEGRIGPIGGIAEKVIAAAESGSSIVLVPASQEEEARSVQPDGLTIIPVATLDEAIEALRTGTA